MKFVVTCISLLCVVNIQAQTVKLEISEKGIRNMLIVSFPLRGVYISPNTPGSKVPSHGTSSFGEEYAIDFVMINENDILRKPYRKSFLEYVFKGLKLEDFYGWGQTIYSPVNGVVVDIENNISERNPVNIFNDLKNTMKVTKEYIKEGASSKIITGNYVIIKIDDNKYSLLAHLKKGSVNVKIGQIINENDVIGQLGHSGNSTMPHLHMQFMNSMDYKVAKGIPFLIKSYEIKINNKWVVVQNVLPKVKDVIRYCTN